LVATELSGGARIQRKWGGIAKKLVQMVCVASFHISVTDLNGKKALRETQTLRAGCSKVEPKIFARRRPFRGGAGRPKFNQLEMVSLPSPTDPVW